MKHVRSLFASTLIVPALVLASLAASPVRADDARHLSRVTGPSPFAPGCNGAPQSGTNYLNAEVEPWVRVNPRNESHLVGVWQQDRWSTGGANGLLTGVSRDGGRTWTRTFAHFSRCAGGNPTNNGDYERASDPWVSFGRTGTLHQISLSFDDSDANNAVLVSRSLDGGNTWSEPTVLIRDTSFDAFNDKESITADPQRAGYAYAVWDRLSGLTNPDTTQTFGPTWFARTTDDGAHWEPAHIIYDPGSDSQTIANQIAVLANGDLVNVMTVLLHESTPVPIVNVAVLLSHDKGASWSAPITVNSLQSVGIVDVKTAERVRTGDIIPSIAADRNEDHGRGGVYVVWQDARFSAGKRDGIVISKSSDGGQTWSAPVQVNKAPQTQAFTAAVTVGENGTVAVSYYDFRKDNADPTVLLTNYWLATSANGGAAWHEQSLSDSFDMRTAPVAGGFFVGDYEGLDHAGEAFIPFFVAANSGNTSNRTDVFSTKVEALDEEGHANREEANASPMSVMQRVESHREYHRQRNP